MVTGTTSGGGPGHNRPLFNEPMRVVIARPNGPDLVEAGLVGLETNGFRKVTLTGSDIAGLRITDPHPTYDGDGNLLRLGIQAYSMGIAHEFDPYFGLSISKVDPLPHQLEAVYEYFMKLPSVRFLLADDAGAGKTIMAGLLVRELKLRGLAERILVVCPANLTFQWQREMVEKFDQQFHVLRGSNIRDQFGMNQWLDNNQVITSLDLAKREDILAGLRQATWDLVIIDEAHRMSASDESHKSQRYRLGELLPGQRRQHPSDDGHTAQGRPQELHPVSATLGPGRLCRREVHRRSDGQEAGALLSPAGRRKRWSTSRSGRRAGSGPPCPSSPNASPGPPTSTSKATNWKLYKDVTDFVKRQSRRAAAQGRRQEGPRHRVPDVDVPEAARLQHPFDEEVSGKPGQKA